MGDIIEITTRARHPTSFYKVSSSAVTFEVKAYNAALVGLAKEPGVKCDYWLGFGSGKIWIKGPDGLKIKQGGIFNLSQNQFKRFWISWDCGTLKVGKGFEWSILLSSVIGTIGLSYITFTTHDPRHAATWKFELPPASISSVTKVPYKRVDGGELHWIGVEEALPDDSVIGGYSGECLYIIRAHHSGSLTPGYFIPSEGVAYISWGGAANATNIFEILCGYNYSWEATNADKIPVTAFEAGYSEVNHEKLYIGRVKHGNKVLTGKVQPSHKVCYVSFEDKEISFEDYDILTIPESNPYPARYHFETNSNWRPLIVNENAFFLNQDDEEEDNDNDEDQESNYESDEDYHQNQVEWA